MNYATRAVSPDMQLLEPALVSAVLRQVNPYFEPRRLGAETTRVEWCSLPFYEDVLLYAFTDHAVMPAFAKYALRRRGDIFVIDYTPSPIMMANRAAPLRLSRETVGAYAKFFSRFVWRHDLPQLLVERIDDLPLIRTLDRHQHPLLSTALRPMQVVPSRDGHLGTYEIDACFLSGISLVSRRLQVLADGNVRCSPDRVLVEFLPVRNDASQGRIAC